MGKLRQQVSGLVNLAAEAAAETLWPTRCALCDRLGSVLCDACREGLPYVDWWRACRLCGSPYGYVQCDACNPVALRRIGRKSMPFEACASAVQFDFGAGQLVRVFKDGGEQRLAGVIAECMQRVLPPEWPIEAITFVPATLAAYRFRGFDHAELIARELATGLGLPCIPSLERPKTRDQRGLAASQRIANLRGSFTASRRGKASELPGRLLLVDDVYTTGATICAASDALLAAGVSELRCLTFARV